MLEVPRPLRESHMMHQPWHESEIKFLVFTAKAQGKYVEPCPVTDSLKAFRFSDPAGSLMQPRSPHCSKQIS